MALGNDMFMPSNKMIKQLNNLTHIRSLNLFFVHPKLLSFGFSVFWSI